MMPQETLMQVFYIVYTLSNAPATPAGLNVTTFSSSEHITWSGSAGTTGYTLYRVIHLMEFMIFLLTPVQQQIGFDTNLIENTVYFYKYKRIMHPHFQHLVLLSLDKHLKVVT
jgi:hypothetical protein